jgi:hypothetical protein
MPPNQIDLLERRSNIIDRINDLQCVPNSEAHAYLLSSNDFHVRNALTVESFAMQST